MLTFINISVKSVHTKANGQLLLLVTRKGVRVRSIDRKYIIKCHHTVVKNILHGDKLYGTSILTSDNHYLASNFLDYIMVLFGTLAPSYVN